MMANSEKVLPQEGTCLSEAGESLAGPPSGSVSPSYSGGGKNRHEGLGPQPDDPSSLLTDSEMASVTVPVVAKEARVLLTRCPTPGVEKGRVVRVAQTGNLSDEDESWQTVASRALELVLRASPARESGTRLLSRCPTPGKEKGEGRVVPRPRTLSESSSASGMSFETVASRTSSPIGWRKRQRANVVDSDDYDDASPSAKAQDRRGRARPSATEGVNLAKAKAALNAAEAEELDAERGMAEDARQKRATRAAILRTPAITRQEREQPETLDLQRVVSESLDTIRRVAETSGHLKGTFVRALNEAADAIKVSFAEARTRTMSEEVARLEAANARLAAELDEVRKELARLQPAPAPAPSLADIARTVMVQVGTMINARFEGLEERLLPAKRLRPPLAADRKLAEAAAAAPAAASRPTHPPPTKTMAEIASVPSTKPQKKKQKAETKRVAHAEPSPRLEPQPPSEPTEEPWRVVARKGATKKKKKAAVKPAVEPGTAPAAPKKKAAPRKKLPKLHPPRTTAVMLTLQPEAVERGVTYLKVLGEAKRKINLKEIGIDGLRFGTAATGARLLILPGASSAEKADALAVKIREAVGEDVVRVSRPEKCVELRISGLDDSVTKEEVVEAVADAGGCANHAIRAGELTRSPGRQGQIWMSVPVAAARKVVEKRLLVGWVSVQAKILEPRPPRCFRCLEPGHVGANCMSSLDRSGLCFCCGKAGHKAAQCSADPHCPICDVAKRAANHRMGGKACPAMPPRKSQKKAAAGPRARPSQPKCPRQEAMDTANR